MTYSIKPRDRIYVKGYGYLSFVKNMGKIKNSQKLLDSVKRPTTDAIKNASKRAIQKTADAIGYFIGNKITNETINASKNIYHPRKMMMLIAK